eukprot:TRINITY_DN6141_c0_g1_i4.p1 TRINITY_DN6141_c0_g1~~TRINITY_DN6141_c0_g1_i4.p1  ORF type:complete len:447 (+),score=107.02 TRINITY_DN6141_c0_g1_i4:449-1789(+)
MNKKANSLKIIDARPWSSAYGNKVKGMGYEYDTSYSKIQFMGIDNIHIVRESLSKIFGILNRASKEQDNWLAQLENTGWLKHIKSILNGAVEVRDAICAGESVLIHCSDGWDRTAQLSSLAQLMLDPYYRTIKGIQVLIEKEWVSFGHKFAERCGQEAKPDERSPVFLQWLDCVHQIFSQIPTAFEFNHKLLLALADEVYSCRFGTFLYNSEYEREIHHVRSRTVSVWSYINTHRDDFANIFFCPTTEALKIKCSLRNIQFWEDFFFRYEDPFSARENIQEVAAEAMKTFRKQTRSSQRPEVNLQDMINHLTEGRTKRMQAMLYSSQILDDIIGKVVEISNQRRENSIETASVVTEGSTPIDSPVRRPSWVPDAWAPHCNDCKRSFTSTRRKHHCRACGNVFCGSCSDQRCVLEQFMYYRPVRVCRTCYSANFNPNGAESARNYYA